VLGSLSYGNHSHHYYLACDFAAGVWKGSKSATDVEKHRKIEEEAERWGKKMILSALRILVNKRILDEENLKISGKKSLCLS